LLEKFRLSIIFAILSHNYFALLNVNVSRAMPPTIRSENFLKRKICHYYCPRWILLEWKWRMLAPYARDNL